MANCGPASRTGYHHSDLVLAALISVQLSSNLIGPAKIAQRGLPLLGLTRFGARVLYFPINYVFGDVLTEVLDHARLRRVIWIGIAALAFASRKRAEHEDNYYRDTDFNPFTRKA